MFFCFRVKMMMLPWSALDRDTQKIKNMRSQRRRKRMMLSLINVCKLFFKCKVSDPE
jgi:hypothetical protein